MIRLNQFLNLTEYLSSTQENSVQGLNHVYIHNKTNNNITFYYLFIKKLNKFYGFPHKETIRPILEANNETEYKTILPNDVLLYRGIYNNGIPFGEIVYFKDALNNIKYIFNNPISDIFIY